MEFTVAGGDERGSTGCSGARNVSAGIASPVKWILRDEVSIIRDQSEAG
jgi:hypothetical protein